ncbi:MAG: cytidine/deoxycytidylate deaminase family protein [Candidatus Cloacimonadota bacterium]|nr:cytidine/deoxycytidylate deaminase family protein [Candidatus Cloacimonadota bacterium]
MKRPSWHNYFMDMAYLISSRATCLRRSVGALLVKNNQVISTGYNGAPKNVPHCAQTGCLREQLNVKSGERHELCRGVHAEQNAIIQAALNGTSIKGAELYCTTHPCSICAKMIINAEIRKVYISQDYNDKLAKKMFIDAGVELFLVKKDEELIKKLI